MMEVKKERDPATRKSNKPLIEKRRRARINDCLQQLKEIIVQDKQLDSSRGSRLEKADILEMTVDYIKRCSHEGVPSSFFETAYELGVERCLQEMSQFLTSQHDQLDATTTQSLANHCRGLLRGHVKTDRLLQQLAGSKRSIIPNQDNVADSSTSPKRHKGVNEDDSNSSIKGDNESSESEAHCSTESSEPESVSSSKCASTPSIESNSNEIPSRLSNVFECQTSSPEACNSTTAFHPETDACLYTHLITDNQQAMPPSSILTSENSALPPGIQITDAHLHSLTRPDSFRPYQEDFSMNVAPATLSHVANPLFITSQGNVFFLLEKSTVLSQPLTQNVIHCSAVPAIQSIFTMVPPPVMFKHMNNQTSLVKSTATSASNIVTMTNAPEANGHSPINTLNPQNMSVNRPAAIINPTVTSVSLSEALVNPTATLINQTTTSVNPKAMSFIPPATDPKVTIVNTPATAVNTKATLVTPAARLVNSTVVLDNPPTVTFANPILTLIKPTPTLVNPTATIVNPKAPLDNPTGMLVNPAATLINPTVTLNNPTLTLVNSTTTLVKSAVTLANPTVTLVNPTATLVSSTVTLDNPAATLVNPKSTCVNPTVTLYNPTVTLVNPAATLVNPTVTLVNPTVTLDNPTFTLVSPTNTTTNSDVKKSTMSSMPWQSSLPQQETIPTSSSFTNLPLTIPTSSSSSNLPLTIPTSSSPSNLPLTLPTSSSSSTLPLTIPTSSSSSTLPLTIPTSSSPSNLPLTIPTSSSPSNLPLTIPTSSSSGTLPSLQSLEASLNDISENTRKLQQEKIVESKYQFIAQHRVPSPQYNSPEVLDVFIQPSLNVPDRYIHQTSHVPRIQSSNVPRNQSLNAAHIQSSNVPHIQPSNVPHIQPPNVPHIQSSNISHIQLSKIPHIQSSNVPDIQLNASIIPSRISSDIPNQKLPSDKCATRHPSSNINSCPSTIDAEINIDQSTDCLDVEIPKSLPHQTILHHRVQNHEKDHIKIRQSYLTTHHNNLTLTEPFPTRSHHPVASLAASAYPCEPIIGTCNSPQQTTSPNFQDRLLLAASDFSSTRERQSLNLMLDSNDTVYSSHKCNATFDSSHECNATLRSSHACNATVDSSHKCNDTFDSSHKCNDTIDSSRKCNDTIDSSRKCNDTIDSSHKCNDTFDNSHKCNDTFDSSHKCNDTFDSSHKCNATVSSSTIHDKNAQFATEPMNLSHQVPSVCSIQHCSGKDYGHLRQKPLTTKQKYDHRRTVKEPWHNQILRLLEQEQNRDLMTEASSPHGFALAVTATHGSQVDFSLGGPLSHSSSAPDDEQISFSREDNHVLDLSLRDFHPVHSREEVNEVDWTKNRGFIQRKNHNNRQQANSHICMGTRRCDELHEISDFSFKLVMDKDQQNQEVDHLNRGLTRNSNTFLGTNNVEVWRPWRKNNV